jgi:hypothetical protein
MTEPTLPDDLADIAADVVEAATPAVPLPVPKRTMSTVSMVALAVAICGGVVLTGLLMTARPAAHDAPRHARWCRRVRLRPRQPPPP